MRVYNTLFLIVVVLAVMISTSIAAVPDGNSLEAQGRADRLAFEIWLRGLDIDQRRGADFWAGERSKSRPVSCSASNNNSNFLIGCQDAQRRLAPLDIRRKTESDYRKGWNANVDISAIAPSSTSSVIVDRSSSSQPVSGSWARFQNSRKEIYAMQNKFDELLDLYARDSECSGVSYKNVEDHVYNIFDKFDSYPRRRESIRDFILQPADLVDLGDAAAKKKCYEAARVNYLQAIRIFTGDIYVAARQRAQIGMEEIRGK